MWFAKYILVSCCAIALIMPAYGQVSQLSAPASEEGSLDYSTPAQVSEASNEAHAFELSDDLKMQLVDYDGHEASGTIVIDTAHTHLYLVMGGGKAMRYGIGVGREGFTWSGRETVSRMAEWPDWYPPAEMIERQPYLPRLMAGGPGNPLGGPRYLSGSHVVSDPRNKRSKHHREICLFWLHTADQ